MHNRLPLEGAGGAAPSAAVGQMDDAKRKVAIVTEIRSTIQDVRDLPTLPNIAFEVMKFAGNPTKGITDLVEVMEVDVALTGKVLRTANSAYYGVPRKIDSLRMALVVIGMDEISNLVTTASVLKAFPARPGGSEWDAAAFWFHSAAIAELTTGLYDALAVPRPTGAYVAGLLHDIGRLVLHQYFHPYLMECDTLAEKEGIPRHRAEQQLLGVDHGHVGAWLAQRWNLPEEISGSIAQHHIRPADAPTHGLSAVIDQADRLFYIMQGRAPEQVAELLRDDNAWREWIGSRGGTTAALVQALSNKMERATRLLDMLK